MVEWGLFYGYDLANVNIEANRVEKQYKRYRSLARKPEPNKRMIIVGDTSQFIVGFSPKPACQKMAWRDMEYSQSMNVYEFSF